MDLQTLISRAIKAGLRVDVSGRHTFIHGLPGPDGKAGITIRILPNGRISRSDDKDKAKALHCFSNVQTTPRNISANEASKALGLPRRDTP